MQKQMSPKVREHRLVTGCVHNHADQAIHFQRARCEEHTQIPKMVFTLFVECAGSGPGKWPVNHVRDAGRHIYGQYSNLYYRFVPVGIKSTLKL